MKTAVKKISVFILISIVLNIFTLGVDAESVNPYDGFVHLSADIPVDDLYPDDEVYLIYRSDEGIPVYGAEINLKYDSEMLDVKKAENLAEDSLSVKEVLNDSKTGNLIYAYTLTGKTQPSPQNDILRITFSAKKSGTTMVLLDSLTLTLVNQDNLEYFSQTEPLGTEIIIKSHEPQPTSKPHYGGGGGGGTFAKPKPTETPKPSEGVKPDSGETEKNPDIGIDESEFYDIADTEWAREAINELKKRRIISGYNGKFYPNSFITRAEVSKILCNIFDLKDIDGKQMSFTDVTADMWFFEYVRKMFQNGLMNGESTEKCNPEQNITREEFAALIGRCLTVKNYDFTDTVNAGEGKIFADTEETAEFAKEHVKVLASLGIINGYSDNTFRPKESITRAETSVMVYRLISYMEHDANAKMEGNSL